MCNIHFKSGKVFINERVINTSFNQKYIKYFESEDTPCNFWFTDDSRL